MGTCARKRLMPCKANFVNLKLQKPCLVCLIVFMLLACGGNVVSAGPLKIHPSNPRYFTDQTGKAIYLSGSHYWYTLQDGEDRMEVGPFNYTEYLDFVKRYNHNFIRLWVWEQAAWAPWTVEKIVFDPPIYLRTGPGKALDGELKFDLSKFNDAYFDRLRARTMAARDRGIYVSIMLFQGWSIEKKAGQHGNPWMGHPFNGKNNVNGISKDLDGDKEGTETHTLLIPSITKAQELYVRKVVDTVNDLDNVLYEISNEDPASEENTAWQYHCINFILDYESKKPKQHPVIMTYPWPPHEDNEKLFKSPAHAVSPGWGAQWGSSTDDYRDDPPVSGGRKVIIVDTDHLWGVGGNHQWVWKTFLRGLNPIFMDPYMLKKYEKRLDRSKLELIRKNMGYTVAYSQKINLSSMVPRNDLSSSKFCLAEPGKEYLIFMPSVGHPGLEWFDGLELHKWFGWATRLFRWNEAIIVDLTGASGEFKVEWFNPRTGEGFNAAPVAGGFKQAFVAPFTGDAVLHLSKE